MPPFTLARDDRRPAAVVIFVADVAAAVAGDDPLDSGCQAELADRPREQQEGGAEAVVDPAAATVGKSHARGALHRLALELSAAAQIGDEAEIIEPGPPSPFEIVGDVDRVGSIVVTEELDPDRDGRKLGRGNP